MHLTDIHCHILPMVDDGPKSLEEAQEILKEAREQDVRYIIVTPHYRPEMFETSMKQIICSYRIMRGKAREYGIKMRLGCEMYRHEDMLKTLDGHKRPTMAKSKYVLIEFSGHDLFSTVRNSVCELLNHGYRPIIAHAERYAACRNLENIKELRNLGAYIQINAGSVLGDDGWRIKHFCFQLMRTDLVDFIASDTHNTKNRKLNLQKCASYLNRKMGKKYVWRIFLDNPLDIWENR